MMRRSLLLVSLGAWVNLFACVHGPVASSPAKRHSRGRLRVQVVDEGGNLLAGVQVYSVAVAWSGPAGAFYKEGGALREFRSPTVTTDNRGEAAVEDARDLLDDERQKLEDSSREHSTIPWGGMGPDQIGGLRGAMIRFERKGWPIASAPMRDGWRQVLGPARSLRVSVVASQLPKAPSEGFESCVERHRKSPERVFIYDVVSEEMVRGVEDDGAIRFEGLGPWDYAIRLTDCGGRLGGFVNALLAEQTVDLSTLRARVDLGGVGEVHLALQQYEGNGIHPVYQETPLTLDAEGRSEFQLPDMRKNARLVFRTDGGCRFADISAGSTVFGLPDSKEWPCSASDGGP